MALPVPLSLGLKKQMQGVVTTTMLRLARWPIPAFALAGSSFVLASHHTILNPRIGSTIRHTHKH